MITNSLVRKVVTTEYAMLRGPLQVLDRTVAARFGDESTVRWTLGRGLGVLDAAAGHLLGTRTLETTPATSGTSADPGPASEDSTDEVDDSSAAVDDEITDSVADDSTDVHTADLVPAEEVERVAEELLEERVETPLTGELAEESDDDAAAMAELRAKHIVEEYEIQQRDKAQD